jgi:hypothetical protein
MTGEAGVAFIGVSGHALVLFIHLRLAVLMAGKTREITKRGWIFMALHTIAPHSVVPTRKNGEKCIMIRQECRTPIVHLVAFLTIGRERIGHVIRIIGCKIILLVARDTFGSQKRKIALLLVLVTTLAIHHGVSSQQRETSICMNLLSIKNLPTLKGMTFLTVVTHLCLMNILVAGDAG